MKVKLEIFVNDHKFSIFRKKRRIQDYEEK